jgi:peptidoglycan/xylan/chitin deacetylase (PgdA/CDA1 family)
MQVKTVLEIGGDRVLDAISMSRLLDGVQTLSGQKCTVLVYHSVASDEANPYISDDVFSLHMDMLQSEFHVLNAEKYLWHLQRGIAHKPRSVLITVDDGLENNYSVIRPIMEQRRLPWVVFATTENLYSKVRLLWFAMLRAVCRFSSSKELSLLGRSWSLSDNDREIVFKEMNEWVSNFPADQSSEAVERLIQREQSTIPGGYIKKFCTMMTAEQLRDLSSSPWVEIGCHTMSHPFLTCVSEQGLHGEIDESTEQLRSLLDRKIRMFAYPSGRYGCREVTRVAALGYECAFAVDRICGFIPRYEIPRVGIYHSSVSVTRAKCLGISSLLKVVGLRTG